MKIITTKNKIKTLEVCGYIYKTTNLITGKIYIGLHRNNKFNSDYLGSGTYLKSSIKKHGRDNFKCEVLEWCKSLEDLEEREIFWIGELNSLNKGIGYNLHPGGGMPPIFYGEDHYQYGKPIPESTKKSISIANTGSVAWNRGKTHKDDSRILAGKDNGMYGLSFEAWNKGITSDDDKRVLGGPMHPQYGLALSEERKEKIRQHHLEYYSIKENCSNYGKIMTTEQKEKISKTRIEKGLAKGENNPMFGKKFSSEHRNKISNALKGKRTGKDNHESVPVQAILKDGSLMLFESMNLASLHFNINYGTLSSGMLSSVKEDGYYTNKKTGIKFRRLDKGGDDF